ncbi:hypothetical protein PILCRDRAFT_693400 [Piloderma croceum F 1598]|uniref:Tetraspanin Tsp2 n=1 Tax=Piloderma croceum (strain F 1598) TaxID=765440 RepID=A0A0C3BBS6_PILCF|nr:hypothetical protein PILCRDRAFT_693400 [Piloderma croceum F 1598]
MERRYPSTESSLASTDRLFIRRRSGKLTSNLRHCNPAYGSRGDLIRNTSQNWPFLAHDEDTIQCMPTVILVNPIHSSKHQSSASHLPLQPASLVEPASAGLSDNALVHRSSDAALHPPFDHINPDRLSPVDLTSHPEASSLSTYGSSQSLVPSSTPDVMPPRDRPFLAFLRRRFNFLSFGRPYRLPSSAFMMVSHEPRPQSVRSVSNYSTSSMPSAISGVSSYSSYSVDSGHSSLISCISTTSKFTHKWPRPRSFRTLSTKDAGNTGTNRLSYTKRVLEEEGQGLQADVCEGQWTRYKWCLFVSVIIVLACGIACLACAIMLWLRIWPQADVMSTADNDVLILATLTGSLLIFAAFIGTTGVFLESRPLLATYAIFLWPGLISMVAVGYVTYKRSTFALDHKLDLAWSQWYTSEGRLLIQDALHCCGFYDPLHDAVPSKWCYPRTPLPGCKGKLYRFEKEQLSIIWTATFFLVALHILNIMVALLCANHITKTFGDGLMPKKYRLSAMDLRADAEKIASCRAGKYGVRSLPGSGSSSMSRKNKEDAD